MVFPRAFPEGVNPSQVIGVGAGIGTLLHRLVEKMIVTVLVPLSRSAGYYLRIVEIQLAVRRGILSDARGTEYIDALSDGYFLSGLPSDVRASRIERARSGARV
jgi:hypothetical protein